METPNPQRGRHLWRAEKKDSLATFFEGEIDSGVALASCVLGDGLVGARVGRLHSADLQPHEVKHLALVLRQRHLLSIEINQF